MDDKPDLGLFEGYGIELEYMIVGEGLDVLPIADRVLLEDGEVVSELERGAIAWSNELVLHVVELKTNGPASSLEGLAEAFQAEVQEVNRRLAPHGGRLLGTAMHPWMDPQTETQLWPHEYGEVYATFDRMFGARVGHGWSNLQSMHINLPYRGDDELRRLHDAIRAVLPLLPALAASSPFVDGRATGLLDNRLDHYRHNSQRIPVITGHVIPERVESLHAYRERVFAPIAAAVAPFDPDGVLDPEWVNARGAIVRPVRDSIEIRLLDVQEHPAADLAIAELVVETVRALVEERWAPASTLAPLDEQRLERTLLRTIRSGERAVVEEGELLACFGVDETIEAGKLWSRIAHELIPSPSPALRIMLERGPLARRLLEAWDGTPVGQRQLYDQLAESLEEGRSLS